MKSSWKKIGKSLLSAIGWWVLGTVILIVVLWLYTMPWTGFGDYTTPTGDSVRGKTLWDWMQLLIIPLFLAAGAIAVNRSEKQLEQQRAEERAKLEREIVADRQREAVLQSYLDRMAELLLEKKLRTSKNGEVRDVARIRTLTVLRGLDEKRKGIILRFLSEANLIDKEDPIVFLDKADLRGADLEYAFLHNVYLIGANLTGANLRFALLAEADLEATILCRADLRGAIFDSNKLKLADLTEANLYGAAMTQSDLKRIEKEAKLTGAIMPDGTKHE